MPAIHRMRDLVELTGVSAPTIHFYAQQGLLPAMVKTAENQALYPDATVRRIRWIRALQSELRLPLRRIATVLERHGELPIAEIRAMQAVGRLLDEPQPDASARDFEIARGHLEPGDLTALVEAGMVTLSGESVSTTDLAVIETVAGLRQAGFTTEAGFPAERILLYRDAVEALVETELRTFVEPLIARGSSESASELIRRGLPLANQLLTLLHQRAIRTEAQQWLEADAGANTATTPS